MSTGINHLCLDESPVAIIDFETTGLSPGRDRVVEISIVRHDPGEEPRLVFDTLVHPERRVSATEIHGITDDDVKDAPLFADIVGDIIHALSGCVVAAYNVYFDIKFLNYELKRSGVDRATPHFCLMYMMPMLELGGRCSLDDACRVLGVSHEACHVASEDALASSRLYEVYRRILGERDIQTFDQLGRLRAYKFVESFGLDPFPDPQVLHLTRCSSPLRSRGGFTAPPDPIHKAHLEYWDALETVLADLEISDEEFQHLREIRAQTPLKKPQLRAIHARVFASAIERYIDDDWLDDDELRQLRKLHGCLSKLGWAPGG